MSQAIVLIGPRSSPGRTGGVTLPFDDLINECSAQLPDSGVSIVDLAGRMGDLVRSCIQVVRCGRGSTVILNVTWRAFLLLGPILIVTCKLVGAKIYFRKFAGDFDARFERLPRLLQALFVFMLRGCTCFFFETNYLVEWAAKRNIRSAWWPNSRGISEHEKVEVACVTSERERVQSRLLKLIFIGRVSKAKGVPHFEQVVRSHSDVVVDVWGEVDDSYQPEFEEMLMREGRICYRGRLERQDVYAVLASYDALILLSDWKAEGYPGVIIEAALVGVPSIASKIRGPDELIKLLGSGVAIDDVDRGISREQLSAITATDSAKLCRMASALFERRIVHQRIFTLLELV